MERRRRSLNTAPFICVMTKENFVEVLKKVNIGASVENGVVTISMLNADKTDISAMFGRVKLIANKVGYKHSFRVCKLEESHDI